MPELSLALAGSAFIAGLLMFLAPCTLPLVPAYLAFISGVQAAHHQLTRQQHRTMIINALAFICGFSLIFITFGTVAGYFGSFFGQFQAILSQIAGAFVVFFGLLLLGLFRISFLSKIFSLRIPQQYTPGHARSSFLIGLAFALGWTPCIGPILATILLLASTTATLVQGALLLVIFSLGLAIPFLLVAILYAQASTLILKYALVAGAIQTLGGIFLVIIGLLLLTQSFGITVEYGYQIFSLLGIDGIFNYL